MAGRLNNKVAVITGRSEEKGTALADRLGPNAVYVKADVMSEEGIKRTIDTAISKFGGLDILFNNAGGPTAGTLTEVDEASIHYAMQLLFSSVVLGIKHAVPHEGRFENCHDLVIDGGRTSIFAEPAS